MKSSRLLLSVATLSVGLMMLLAGLLGSSVAMADDLADVTAANNGFYLALSARDTDAMAKVYAHESYVANIEPTHSGLEIGWPGVEKWARGLAEGYNQLGVTTSDVHVRVNGNAAWVVAREHATGTLKNGTAFDSTLVSTNIYEKQGGRWMMVLHEAQFVPK
jgi:ketosteroid isomerase-like protein